MPRLSCIALLLAVAVGGCDTDVPAASADGRDFTIWGQLDPTADTQAIRVDPISPTIDGTLDFRGQVVSEDLTTGEITAWRDSLVTFPDGSTGHVFMADYRPDYDSTVELRVEQDGDRVTYGRVTVPPNVTPFFGELTSGTRNRLDLLLPGAPRVVGARVIYEISGAGEEQVVVEPQDVESIEFGWRVRIDFSRQVEILRSRFRQRDILSFNATGVRVRVAIANDEWAAPFPFSFSRDLLIQPGTVSNIRGGYGFLGGAYTIETEWVATEDEIRRLGL